MRGAWCAVSVVVALAAAGCGGPTTIDDDAAVGDDAGASFDAGLDTGFACAHARDCAPGTVCIGGLCVAPTMCTTSRECPGLVCDTVRRVCAECVGTGDCPGGFTCRFGVCEPPLTACASDRDCSAMRLVCDVADRVCVECNHDNDCLPSQLCRMDHACIARSLLVDAGPSDGGNIDAGSDCDPMSTGMLASWYTADFGVMVNSGTVVSWAPRMPGPALAGTGAVLRPSAIHGHPAIDFSSGSLTSMCPPGMPCGPFPPGPTVYTAFVYRATAPTGGTMLMESVAGGRLVAMPHPMDPGFDWVLNDPGGTSTYTIPATDTPLSVPHLGALLIAGGTATTYVDRTMISSITDGAARGLSMSFGLYSVGVFSGQIAEIIVATGPVSAAQVHCIDQHLAFTYGIATH